MASLRGSRDHSAKTKRQQKLAEKVDIVKNERKDDEGGADAET